MQSPPSSSHPPYRDWHSAAAAVMALLAVSLLVTLPIAAEEGSGRRTFSAPVQENAAVDNQAEQADQPSAAIPEGPLLREGDQWNDELGQFHADGARVAFRPVRGGRPVVVLENLNLQRVLQVTHEARGTVFWSISGTITEFQGRNYLLISRATRKSRASVEALGGQPLR